MSLGGARRRLLIRGHPLIRHRPHRRRHPTAAPLPPRGHLPRLRRPPPRGRHPLATTSPPRGRHPPVATPTPMCRATETSCCLLAMCPPPLGHRPSAAIPAPNCLQAATFRSHQHQLTSAPAPLQCCLHRSSTAGPSATIASSIIQPLTVIDLTKDIKATFNFNKVTMTVTYTDASEIEGEPMNSIEIGVMVNKLRSALKRKA